MLSLKLSYVNSGLCGVKISIQWSIHERNWCTLTLQNIKIKLDPCVSYFIGVMQWTTKHASEFCCHTFKNLSYKAIFIYLFVCLFIYFYEVFLLKCLQIPAEDLLKLLRASVCMITMQKALRGLSEAVWNRGVKIRWLIPVVIKFGWWWWRWR